MEKLRMNSRIATQLIRNEILKDLNIVQLIDDYGNQIDIDNFINGKLLKDLMRQQIVVEGNEPGNHGTCKNRYILIVDLVEMEEKGYNVKAYEEMETVQLMNDYSFIQLLNAIIESY